MLKWRLLALAALMTSAGIALAASAQGEPQPDALTIPSRVELAWVGNGPALAARATAAHRRALQLGVQSLDAAARAIAAPGAPEVGLSEAILAVKLAPDLPVAHLLLSQSLWRQGQPTGAARALSGAVGATFRHPEALFWLTGSLLLLAAGVMVFGSLAFIAVCGLTVCPRAAHDLGDLISRETPAFARAALVSALLLVPLALGEGPMGLALALFGFGCTYGEARQRLALSMAVGLLLLGLGPVGGYAGAALGALGADRVAAAVDAVARDSASSDELALLTEWAPTDALAAQALAVDARRRGDVESARLRYQELRRRQPLDPIVMTNLANLHFESGEFSQAIDLYERAAALLESPILLFNLSQAFARNFRMEESEAALRAAQAHDAAVVAELLRSEKNDMVADLPLSARTIRNRRLRAATGAAFARELTAPVAPGYLGARWVWLAGAFAAMGLFSLVLGGRFEHASSCARCGRRICSRCDGPVWNSETCDGCHRVFEQPETTDATLRSERLGRIRLREQRIDRAATIAAFLIPGAGGIMARRPDLALLAILIFAWSVVALAWSDGVVPDPLVVGPLGPGLLIATGVLAIIGYLVLAIASIGLARRRS